MHFFNDACGLDMAFDPFPHGVGRTFLVQTEFEKLRATFPPATHFTDRPDLGNKRVLNEHRSPEQFRRFLSESPVWSEFYAELKTPELATLLIARLKDIGIDLGVCHLPVSSPSLLRDARVETPEAALSSGSPRVECRLELFRQPAPSGFHLPHTDRPGKLVTFLIGFNANDWPSERVGALAICRAKSQRHQFNYCNRYMTFDDVVPLHKLQHRCNTANIVVKTHNSIHAVFASERSDETLPDKLTAAVQLYVAPLPFR